MMSLVVLVLGCLMLAYSCNGSVKEIVREMQRELQQLKTKTASFENEIQQLKKKAASYEDDMQSQKKASAKEFQALRTSSAKEITLLKEEIKELRTGTLNTSVAIKPRFILGTNSFAEKPAFSASLKSHALNLGNYQPIVFDNVFTNDLNGYSGLTGIFTAPVNGTYFFTATVMSHEGQYLETQICLNGNTLVYMHSYDTNYEQGTNSIVLVLKSGDKVWVRHAGNQGTKAYGSNYSSFSGFMI